MAYDFYFDKTRLPVPPQKLQVKINGNNKTMTLINEGEINVLKMAGLTDISLTVLLPNVKYPFAHYDGGFMTEDETEHTHVIHDTYTNGGSSDPTAHKHAYIGRKSFVVHNGLVVGDEVILIRTQGGQKFIVIDRLGAM